MNSGDGAVVRYCFLAISRSSGKIRLSAIRRNPATHTVGEIGPRLRCNNCLRKRLVLLSDRLSA